MACEECARNAAAAQEPGGPRGLCATCVDRIRTAVVAATEGAGAISAMTGILQAQGRIITVVEQGNAETALAALEVFYNTLRGAIPHHCEDYREMMANRGMMSP